MDIKEYLEKHEMTQVFLADKLGVTPSHLRMLIWGKSSPSKRLARRIEKFTKGEVTKEEAMFFEDYRS